MSGAMVLVAEDEAEIADILKAYLERAGFRVVVAQDGPTALRHFQTLKPNIALLDVKMPRKDGVEVLRSIRAKSETPVIMITALGEDVEKISALRLGADDYIVKPFNTLEVVERVKAVLRRASARPQDQVLRIGPLEIDESTRAVFARCGDAAIPIALTATEFALISHMAAHPRRAYSRAELIEACSPDGEALERTIDSHVSHARRKLEAAGARGFFETVRGAGYRLEPLADA